MEPSLLQSTLLVSRFKLVSYIGYLSCEPSQLDHDPPLEHIHLEFDYSENKYPQHQLLSAPPILLFDLARSCLDVLNFKGRAEPNLPGTTSPRNWSKNQSRSFFQLYNTNKMITVLHKIMVPIVEHKTSFNARKLNAGIRRKRLKISLAT